MSTPALTSFAGGELSPLLTNRTDIEKYRPGCQTLQSMIVLPQGGVTRRSGTEFIAFGGIPLGSTTPLNSRLIEFARSNTISHILEFGENYIRVYLEGAPIIVESGWDAWDSAVSYIPGNWVMDSGNPYYCIKANINEAIPNTEFWIGSTVYEVWTPYSATEVTALKLVQSADVMYLVHPDHEVHKLSSIGSADFTLEKVEFQYQAFKDENIETDERVKVHNPGISNTWVANLNYKEGAGVRYGGTEWFATRYISEYEVSEVPGTGTEWTLTGSTPPNLAGSVIQFESENYDFTIDDIGKYILIKSPRDDNSISEKLNNVSPTPTFATTPMAVKGTWNMVTHGLWDGTIEVQRSYDNGVTWIMHRTYSSVSDWNGDITDEEEEDNVLYRVEYVVKNSGSVTIDFNVEDAYYNRIYKLVEFINANELLVQIIEDETIVSSPPFISQWALGAWGGVDFGYPRAIAFHEERLTFAGNLDQPLTLWFSRISDYEDLTTGVFATSALNYTLASDKVFAIRWLVSHTRLLIGTSGDEWQIGGNKVDEPIAPDNVQAKRQSTYGSEDIQAILINNVVMFVQRGGRKLREMAYDYQTEVFISPDMSIMAEHITKTGIVDMLFQQNPYPILWCVRTDGKLIGFTYEKEQQVFAWHIHEISDALVKNIAVIPNENSDELWANLYREDKHAVSENDRAIERFSPIAIPDVNTGLTYLDSSLEFDGGDPVDIGELGQTANTPFAFDIAGHGFANLDKIRVIAHPDFPTEAAAFPFLLQVFTVRNVAGDAFDIWNEANSSAWDSTDPNHDFDFDYLQFEVVTNSVSGLSNLLNRTIGIHADDIPRDEVLVSAAGVVELGQYYNKVLAGTSFTSILKPMNLESDLADGASQGRRKRITELLVSFHNTVGGIIETDKGIAQVLDFRKVGDVMNDPIPLFSGYKKVDYDDGYDKKKGITIKQEDSLPMTVIMIQPWIQVYN